MLLSLPPILIVLILSWSLYDLRNYKGTEFALDKRQIIFQTLAILAYAVANVVYQEEDWNDRQYVVLYIKLVCDWVSLVILQATLVKVASL